MVLQFGSSDLVVPVRKKRHHQAVSEQAKVAVHPATLLHLVRWRVRGLIGDLLQLKPVTAPEIYLDTMESMVRSVAASQAIPVVLSPFVLGAQRSNRIARRCVPLLDKRVAAVPAAYYVEAYSDLDRFPRRQMLLPDGTHLSIQGQAVVAECLWPVLVRVLQEQNEKFAARPPPSAAPPPANGPTGQASGPP